MKALQFSTKINASRTKVWESLWNDASYQEWTSVFMEGSKVVTKGHDTVIDWNKGAEVLFTDGSGNGMLAVIADNRPNEFMSFRHLGEIKDGEPVSEKAFSDNFENYTLKEVNGITELVVDLDTTNTPTEFIGYFEDTFPKALEKIKAIAERS